MIDLDGYKRTNNVRAVNPELKMEDYLADSLGRSPSGLCYCHGLCPSVQKMNPWISESKKKTTAIVKFGLVQLGE